MADSEKRYQVFISSTYKDLIEERQAVLSALLQLDAIPSGMELFPASDNDAWTLIQQIIDNCDYYILILAGVYGSIGPTGLSYTEMEYDYAQMTGKPTMAFVHGDPDAIISGKSEKTAAGRTRLADFREKVQLAKHTKQWLSADDLAGKVALSYPATVKERPAVGWVRADIVASSSALVEIHELRSQVDALGRELAAARTTAPAGTGDLSQGEDVVSVEAIFDIELEGDATDLEENHLAMDQVQIAAVDLTWNQILRSVGPRLLDEATEKQIRTELETVVQQEYWTQDLHEAYLDSVEGEGWTLENLEVAKTKIRSISETDFDLILVQLMALGLIQKGQRARGLDDMNTYWSLSPYGQSEVVKVMALRRNGKRAADGGE